MFWHSKSELWDYALSQFGLLSGPIIFQQRRVRPALEGCSEAPQIQTSTHNTQHRSRTRNNILTTATLSRRHELLWCHLVGEKRAQDGVADHRAEVDGRDGY